MLRMIKDVLALVEFFHGVIAIPVLSMEMIVVSLVLYIQLGAGVIDIPINWRLLGMGFIVGFWLLLAGFSTYTIRSTAHKYV